MPTAAPRATPLDGDTGYTYWEVWPQSNAATPYEGGLQYNAASKTLTMFWHNPVEGFQVGHVSFPAADVIQLNLGNRCVSSAQQNWLWLCLSSSNTGLGFAVDATDQTNSQLYDDHTSPFTLATGPEPGANPNCCRVAYMTTIAQWSNRFSDGASFSSIRWGPNVYASYGDAFAELVQTTYPLNSTLNYNWAGYQDFPNDPTKVLTTWTKPSWATDTSCLCEEYVTLSLHH